MRARVIGQGSEGVRVRGQGSELLTNCDLTEYEQDISWLTSISQVSEGSPLHESFCCDDKSVRVRELKSEGKIGRCLLSNLKKQGGAVPTSWPRTTPPSHPDCWGPMPKPP